MKKIQLLFLFVSAFFVSSSTLAAEYKIDTKGAHAFIQFKINHLGFSWLLGRFNEFDGNFTFDAKNPDASKIAVVIQTASIDSNHAERDKHLRSDDFLDVKQFPTALFKSTSITFSDQDKITVTGDFTLKGVTRSISFPASKIGEGKDPWGGYRSGFEGKTTLKLTDYNINTSLGPASTHVDIFLYVEGIRK